MPFMRIYGGLTSATAQQAATMFREDGAAVETAEDDGSYILRVAYPDALVASSSSVLNLQPAQPGAPPTSIGAGATPWQRLIAALQARQDLTNAQKVACLSQWTLESGHGTSDLATKHLNFGGLKYRARMEGFATPVDYHASDGEDSYCKFASEDAFITGYWRFISSGPYDGWEAFKDNSAGYIRHIASNYAADAAYVTKVLSLFDEAQTLLGGLGGVNFGGGAASGGEISSGGAAAGPSGTELRLAIVVGHNSVSPGASAVAPISRSEFKFNNEVADAMVLEAPHYNIFAKRFNRVNHNSYSAEIAAVYAEVDAWSAGCALELHFNSLNAQSTGTEMLHASGSTRGRELGLKLVGEVGTLLGLKIRHINGLKALQSGDRGYSSVVASAAPTVLVEPFFGSNKEDCLKVAAAGEEALARAYLRAVRDWTTAEAQA